MLDIQLFGQLEMRLGDELVQPFPTKKSKSLFAFLVTNRGRAFPREVLATMFWGDQEERSARKCLRTAIWRARSTVAPKGAPAGTCLIDRDHALSFGDGCEVRVDVEEFERRIASHTIGNGDGNSPFVYRSLQDAVRLYRADFLEGIYDEWALTERYRLKSLLLDVFHRLIVLSENRQDWSGAIMWCERLLAYDALQENVYRDMMRFYAFAGNRPAVLRTFEKLCGTLKSELGVTPMRETFELYEAIRTERGPTPALSPTPLGSGLHVKQKFSPPTLYPLIVLRDQTDPVPGLAHSTVFGNGSPPSRPH